MASKKSGCEGRVRTYDFKNFHGCFLSSEKPTVTMSPKVHPSLVEGERLTLTCRANEATKEIRWTKDDLPVNSRANIYPIGNNSTLVIENVLTSDSGRYACEARNDAGSASSSVDVRVTGNKNKLINQSSLLSYVRHGCPIARARGSC